MVWNTPSDQKPNDPKSQEKDPWTGRPKNSSPNQGPPLLDETLKKLFNQLQQMINLKKKGSDGNGNGAPKGPFIFRPPNPKHLLVWLATFMLLLWFFLGLKQVGRNQEGIVTRFGVYHSSLSQGWHWRPFGVDNIQIFDRGKQYQETVSSDILSQDLNLAQVTVQVKYHVNDPKLYLFNFQNPSATIHALIAQSLVQTAGSQNLDSLFANAQDSAFLRALQSTMIGHFDQYNLGIKVDSLELTGVAVPDSVKEVFNKIDALYAEQAKQKQQAQDYEQQMLPPAQAKADQIIAQAKSYADQVQLKAKEDVSDFMVQLPAYQKAPEVTKYRLYMEAMHDILSKTPKVVVDNKAGTPVVNLPPLHKTAPVNDGGSNGSNGAASNANATVADANDDPNSSVYANVKGGY